MFPENVSYRNPFLKVDSSLRFVIRSLISSLVPVLAMFLSVVPSI